MGKPKTFIKIGSLYIKKNIHFSLPEDIVVKFNIVMRKQGFSTANDFVIHIIRKSIEEYLKQHPEILHEIEEYENLYRLRVGRK